MIKTKYAKKRPTGEPVLQMVPRDSTVAGLVEDYRLGNLSYTELAKEFDIRGWSTVSLYENVRHLR